MRWSRSMVVMGTLTSVAFGLAIRDTLRTHAAEVERDVERAQVVIREAADERDRVVREAMVADAERAELAARTRAIAEMIGAVRGAPGPAIAFLSRNGSISGQWTLGVPALSTHGLRVATSGIGFVDAIHVTVTSVNDDGCRALAEPMRAAWGAPTPLDDEHLVWRGPDHARATIDTVACSAEFGDAIDVDHFIGPGTDAFDPVIGLGLIGAPVDPLGSMLDMRAESGDGQLRWDNSGLADGAGDTQLTAYVKAGKVIGLSADGITSATALAALQARLTTLLGAPPTRAGNVSRWKTRPRVLLSVSGMAGTMYRLELGTVPAAPAYP